MRLPHEIIRSSRLSSWSMPSSCSPPICALISYMLGSTRGFVMLRGRNGAVLPLPTAGMRFPWGYTPLTTVAMFARKKPLGLLGGLILLLMVVLALLGPWIAPFDPYEVHVLYKYAEPGAIIEETGQRLWLGADQLGRDTLSRLMYGAQVSLYVSLISVGLGVTVGALVGIIS